MSLRSQIQFIIATCMAFCMGALIYSQVNNTRSSVREEVEGSNVVATHLLARMSLAYQYSGTSAMVAFLDKVGHVRANDVLLFDSDGRLVYHSPPPTYKFGRDAPAWFSALVAPRIEPQVIAFGGGRLVIQADPSRAILDGWEDLVRLVGFWGVLCVILLAIAFFLGWRALRPLEQIVEGLARMEQGAYHTRLPELPGGEARRMSIAFNRMAQSVEETAAAKRAADEARLDLEQHRELTHTIQSHIEAERRSIARELHDELGQSITAIKSMGLSILQRSAEGDERLRSAARLIVDTAARMYDSVHELIQRLRAFEIEESGLGDALQDLVSDLRQRHPDLRLVLSLQPIAAPLGDAVATAAYRIVQESLTNALRHAQAHTVTIDLRECAGQLLVRVEDDGRGLAAGWERTGHFGVLGMRERCHAVGGVLEVGEGAAGGVAVTARLPLEPGSILAAHGAKASPGPAQE